MLAQAQIGVPEVALVEGDMRTFDLGRRFDAVVCLFSAIGYMRTTGRADVAVAAMARHLNLGGVMIVDAGGSVPIGGAATSRRTSTP